ncbi:MAG: PEGA domain-containing protein, partial [Acidobacteria bacterium]|nr:PEGA domain-containing protein [Acidobacteriota bacterium]
MIASGVYSLPYDDSAGFTAPPAFGTFRVLHQIGSGVLGPVFRTFEPERERLIAVKAFRLDIVPEMAARLAQSLRTVVATPIPSPRVVPAVGAGLEGMTAFLASEYVTAETFDVALRRLAPAPLARALPLLRQMADALEAGWRAGHGHGGLHPRDVFVSSDGDPGAAEIRIGGFGVVQALDALGIKAPIRRPYTAPERVAGGPWDMRADVYSLGVLAHELLTGRRPAGSGEQDGALPTGTTPEQRVAIRKALAGVLADDPALRYPTPSAFVDALETGDAPVVVVAAAEDETPLEETAGAEPAEEDAPLVTMTPGLPFDHIEPATEVDEPSDDVAQDDLVEDDAEEADEDTAGDEVAEGETRVAHWDDLRPGAASYSLPALPPTPVTYAPEARVAWSWPAIAAAVVAALVLGGAIAYWLIPGVPVDDQLDTVVVGDEAPVGTDVTVSEPVAGSPAATTPATPPPATPPPAPAPATAPAATRGRVLVRSEPAGARVMISGRNRGTTPATVRDLPFGTYNVTVSLAGYQSRVVRVTVSRAVPARDVTVPLQRAVPAPAAVTTGTL